MNFQIKLSKCALQMCITLTLVVCISMFNVFLPLTPTSYEKCGPFLCEQNSI